MSFGRLARLYLTIIHLFFCFGGTISFSTAFSFSRQSKIKFGRANLLVNLPFSTSTSSRTISRRLTTTMTTSASSTIDSTRQEDPLETFGLPQPLLLGSASFTRKLILKEMGVNYHKLVRPIDEKSLGDRSNDKPFDLVLTLAKAKMDHLVQEIKAGRCQEDLPASASSSSSSSSSSSNQQQQQQEQKQEEWVVLTGDQVVTCDGTILEKPESVQEAKEFVARYAHSPPSTVGSCVLTHLPSGIQVSGVDTATIYFRTTVNSADLIDNLLKDDAPVLSCAGGLMIEHPLVREHVERIDGTEDSVMGLSKDLVIRLMQELAEAIQTNNKQPKE